MATDLVARGVLSPDQVHTHPLAHVLTRSIGGHAGVQVDTLTIALLPGDRFVLCSDGLANYLASADELARQIEGVTLAAVPKLLVSYANGSGGRDNITVVAVDIDSDPLNAEAGMRTGNMRRQLRALADAPLFDERFLADLLLLIDTTDVREYLAGEKVLACGRESDALYLPLEGTLVVTSPEGHSRTVERGGVVGATMLLNPRTARATVTSQGESRVLLVDTAGLRDLIVRHPRFGVDVLQRLGAYLSQELDQCRRASPLQVEL